MRVTIVGVGMGGPEMMTQECLSAIEEAELIVGAQRLIEGVESPAPRYPATKPERIEQILTEHPCGCACVLMSGDVGFYSGARGLTERLEGWQVRLVPGLSSAQVLAARLRQPWQDWKLVSAHGVDCAPAHLVSRHEKTFFLTGGKWTVQAILCALCVEGLEKTDAAVGERLGYPDERITRGTAEELMNREFAPLSVLLCTRTALSVPHPYRNTGIADEEFLRGETPMTKQEVRACVLAKLCVRETDTLWDVGSGTGSVAVEMARLAQEGQVYAVERDGDACALIERNRSRFAAYNLHTVRGTAPEALRGLPAPDAVFIGGSGGNLLAIVEEVLRRNPAARICMTAIALETLSEAMSALFSHGCKQVECVQVAVSRAKAAGCVHMLTAQNPIFVISAEGASDGGA